jgi:quinol-cytochrome oxidoreductase complex cytochrome b subunit
VGIGDPADPMNTPAHVKPEWYFLSLYQLLKFIPKTIGAVLPVILVGLITIWPFIDRKPDTSPRIRRIRFIFAAIGVIVIIALTIWGAR